MRKYETYIAWAVDMPATFCFCDFCIVTGVQSASIINNSSWDYLSKIFLAENLKDLIDVASQFDNST
jgi:hypothetical protein